MKVCFISHSSAKGGAERALLELVDALKERGVECYIMLPGHGPLINELKNREVAYCTLPYKWWMGKNSPIWKRIGRAVLNLAIVIPAAVRIERWRCDVVCTNTITVCVGALAAKLLGLPHVWHIHEFGYEDHGLVFDLGSKFSLWLINRLSTICIANSHAVAKKYRQYIEPSKVKVVYQSVSVPQNEGTFAQEVVAQSDRTMKAVIVGTLQEGKGQEDAVRAIAELIHQGIRAELFVVGGSDPEYRRYLYDLVVKNRIEKFVKFMGYVDNPFPIMQMADVGLMCSRYEAFGRVTVEFLKLGKPVIGARSGGTVELIQEGFNGLLYTPGDYKELAERIRYLYEHPDLARRMGENGRRWASEQFVPDRYADGVLKVLREALA